MILYTYKDYTQWHRWFAWYPVCIRRQGRHVLVWLEPVLRCADLYIWEYRDLEQ